MFVDWPKPSGRRNRWPCGRGTVRSTWSTATSFPNCFVRPRALIAASLPAIEFNPHRKSCRQLRRRAAERDLCEVAEPRRVLADEGVVRREAGLAANHAHAARERRRHAVDEYARGVADLDAGPDGFGNVDPCVRRIAHEEHDERRADGSLVTEPVRQAVDAAVARRDDQDPLQDRALSRLRRLRAPQARLAP